MYSNTNFSTTFDFDTLDGVLSSLLLWDSTGSPVCGLG